MCKLTHASFSLFSNQLAYKIHSVPRGVFCLLSYRLIYRLICRLNRSLVCLIPAFSAQPFLLPLVQLLMPRNIFVFVFFRTSAANDTTLFSSRTPPVENLQFCYSYLVLAFLWVIRPRTTALRFVIHGLQVVGLGLLAVGLEPKP